MKKIFISFLFFYLYISSVYAMAKTFVWECQVIKINDNIQSNGKINSYKIDVTTPMIWVRDDTRWSGLVNTKFYMDKEKNTLNTFSKLWNGIFDLDNKEIIFTNIDANLLVQYSCIESK